LAWKRRTRAAGSAPPNNPRPSNNHQMAGRRRYRRAGRWDSTTPPHNRFRNNRRCRNIPLAQWDSNRARRPCSRPDSTPRYSCIERCSSFHYRAPRSRKPWRWAEPGSGRYSCWWAEGVERWDAGRAPLPAHPGAPPRHRRARSPRPLQDCRCPAGLSARCAGCAEPQGSAPGHRTGDRP
jgi:hypothetical protein